MAVRYSVRVLVDIGDRDAVVALRALQDAVATHGVRLPFATAPMMSRPTDSVSGHHTAYFDLLADDEDELRASVQTVVDVLGVRGIVTIGTPELVSAKPEETPVSHFPGVRYDADQQLLEVQTWAPDQFDLEIDLVQGNGEGEVVVLLTSSEGGERSEEGFPVRHLRIERPAGPGALDPLPSGGAESL